VWPAKWFRASLSSLEDQDDKELALLASYERYRTPVLHSEADEKTYWIPILEDPGITDPFSFHEISDLEVGATAGFISARVGINPLEIADFFLGFIGLDAANDDD